MRKELVQKLTDTIDNLPYGFHSQIFGGGYQKTNDCRPQKQVWGGQTWAVHVAAEMIESFNLTRNEVFELCNISTEMNEDDKRTLRGIACGFLKYCMGSYEPRYTRKK